MKEQFYMERTEKKQGIGDIIIGFDPIDELDRAVTKAKSLLDLTTPKSTFIRSPEEEARRAKEHLGRALAQIDSVQQDYMNRLRYARESGAITNEDYIDALFRAQHFGPFDRLKREVRDIYGGK